MSDSLPTLWQIEISHFSEKARWALAYKGVEHRRRAPLPGAHMPVALWLTRGEQKTFPILSLDGRNIGDSSAIIEALERRFPEPPLYPADPEQRRRALELEEFFDEEVGPHVRHLAFHEMREDPERLREIAEEAAPGPLPGGVAARLRPRLHQPALEVGRLGGGRGRPREDRRRLRPHRGGARLGRLPGRRDLQRRRPGRRVAALPGRRPRRGTVRRRGPLEGDEALPRAARRARRLQVGRGDVRPPPQAGEGRRGRLARSVAHRILTFRAGQT